MASVNAKMGVDSGPTTAENPQKKGEERKGSHDA
jgi:hypothetical protein